MYLILLLAISLPIIPIVIGLVFILRSCIKDYKKDRTNGKKGTANKAGIIITSILLTVPAIVYFLFFFFWALDGFTLSFM